MKFHFLLLCILGLPLTTLAQSAPIGTSLLMNGGFESGFGNWTVDKTNTTLNTTTPLAGSTSLRLGRSPGGRAQIISSGFEIGAKYRVSGYGNVSAASDLATLGAEFFNSSGTRIANQWIQVRGTPAKLYSFDVQVPRGTSTIHVYVFKNAGNQPVDFDTLDFVKIANP